jgi:hypothetical protein
VAPPKGGAFLVLAGSIIEEVTPSLKAQAVDYRNLDLTLKVAKGKSGQGEEPKVPLAISRAKEAYWFQLWNPGACLRRLQRVSNGVDPLSCRLYTAAGFWSALLGFPLRAALKSFSKSLGAT